MAQSPNEVQARLTQIAMAVRPQGMVADQVLPRIPVPAELFKYTKFNTEEQFTIPDTNIGRSSAANEVEFSAILADGSTKDWGLDDFVPIKDIDTARDQQLAFDPMAVATESTSILVDLSRESRVSNLIFSLATYAADKRETLSGTAQWSDYTNSDPVADIDDAIDSLLLAPNILVLGRAVWRVLRKHPKLVASILNKAGTAAAGVAASGKATPEAVAEFFELDKVVIGSAFGQTSKKGQAPAYSRLWGPHASLLHINPNVTSAQAALPTFGFTAEWQRRRVRLIQDQKRGIDGGTTIRVAEQLNELITFQELGYHFHNAVA